MLARLKTKIPKKRLHILAQKAYTGWGRYRDAALKFNEFSEQFQVRNVCASQDAFRRQL